MVQTIKRTVIFLVLAVMLNAPAVAGGIGPAEKPQMVEPGASAMASGILPQNDARSGQDAPDGPSPEVWVDPGVPYQGDVTVVDGDREDWYAFSGEAGQVMQLRTMGHALCHWDVKTPNGDEVPSTCVITFSGEIRYEATLPSTGTFYAALNALSVPAHYRFAFALDEPAPAPVSVAPDVRMFGVSECPQADPAEAARTHGSEDPQIPTLVWAALKTGFRAVVAWTAPEPATATLRVLLSDGTTTEIDDPAPRNTHSFVLDDLPEGEILCFQAEYTTLSGTIVASDWHAVRLLNAFNAYNTTAKAYTTNLLVLANENHIDRDILEAGVDAYAELLWDASDGHVRSGAVIVLYGDLDKHNSGFFTCGYLPAFVLGGAGQYHKVPTCRTYADVVFSYDNAPIFAGVTFLDGIQDRWAAIYMNNLHEAPPARTATPGEVGYVLLHELGHYAFGMMDLYGFTPDDCFDPATAISVMGADRRAREFDDDTTRCPDWQQIASYVPSWTRLMERFPAIPERPGHPQAGPFGDGGDHQRHVFEYITSVSSPQVPQDDAGSGRDAPAGPPPEVWVDPGVRYQGFVSTVNGDQEDWYAFSGNEGQTVQLRTMGQALCQWTVTESNGDAVDTSCALTLSGDIRYEATLPSTGTFYLAVASSQPSHYKFAYELDMIAPHPVGP